MPWFSKNYEKVALGAAAIAAIGLTFLGWTKLSAVDEEFNVEPKGSGKNDPAVTNADLVATAKSSFQLERAWIKGDDEGRPVDLFTGVPLFVNKNDTSNPVDLPESEPVHPPIPNQWWVDNRIDPGFGDSPLRDEDKDGFSNLEEFTSKTDPNNDGDYPDLITKLIYSGDESLEWVLRPGFEDQGSFSFEYSDNERRQMRTGPANPVMPGTLFFDKDPIKERFKLLGAEIRKEKNEAIDQEVEANIVKIEDQKPNKKGTVYEIPAMFRKDNARKFYQYDRTAVLSLNALGLEGKEFKVEEFTTFALPPNAKVKNYTLKEITPDMITIEYKNSDAQTVTIAIAKGTPGPVAP
ncbi:MAG: hypothetical protein H7Y36_00620 [Armatimonadetes bacterium]|nr:hypothetical protein [Akkermansiaceae bacterium]